MITVSTGLLLHLPLNTITDGTVADISGNGNKGTVQGTPQTPPSETLGSSLELDGNAQYISLPPGSLPVGNEITVSFWANGGATLPKNSAIIEADDKNGAITLSIRVPWGDGSIDFACGNDSISQAAQPTDFKGSWVCWAFTKNATTGNMNIYRNGTLWLSGSGKSSPLPSSFVVTIGATADGKNCYQGNIAHVRVYNQALSVADITRDMEADQTALSSFRKSYPIDFRLYNSDQQEVLDITDNPAGQTLYVEISNASRQVINLTAPANIDAGASNYHFALRFRPGTLSELTKTYLSYAAFALPLVKPGRPTTVLTQTGTQIVRQPINLTEAFQFFTAPTLPPAPPSAVGQSLAAGIPPTSQTASPSQTPTLSGTIQAFAIDTASTLQSTLQQQGWNIGYQQEPDGTTVVYFLSTQAQLLATGTKVTITLPHVIANGAGGARGTRVELRYQQMTFGNDPSPLKGIRQIYLSIVNQRGQKQIPLHVSCVGFNSILNDGQSENSLTLRITNTMSLADTLTDGSIALNPVDSITPSRFILSFDVQADNGREDWALGTLSQVSAIQVTASDSNWVITPPSGQGQTPEWIVMPKSQSTLAAGGAIQLNLTNIISSLPSGQTNLYLRYENISGYWDGQFIVTLEKAPLLFRESSVGAGSSVGIGTITPTAALTISNPGLLASLPVSSPSYQQPSHLQLRREFSEKNDDQFAKNKFNRVLFLELYQDDETPASLPPTYPAIRFHHHNRFWERIEGREDGIHFKTGNINPTDHTSDDDIDIFAGTGNFNGNGNFTGSVDIGKQRIEGLADGIHFITPNTSATGSVPLADIFAGNGTFNAISVGTIVANGSAIVTDGPAVPNTVTVNGSIFAKGNIFASSIIASSPCEFGDITVGTITVGNDKSVAFVVSVESSMFVNKNLAVGGTLSAGTKNFLIDHPSKPDHHLIHACLEGPEVGVYYRGQAQLEDGQATIHLPDYFEALTRQEGRTVLLTPKGREPFLLSHEEIVDSTFKVYGTKAYGAFSWEVKAVRADVQELEVEVRKEER